jgi:hypothetical protein
MEAMTLRRRASSVAAAGLLVMGMAMSGAWLERLPAHDVAADLVYLPDAKLLRPLVLGYDAVLADVIWFRTINYFGAHYEGDHLYPWLAAMCDLVTDLDPRAEHVYRFGGLLLPWEAGQVDAGIRLLEKGIAVFPESWTLHYYLGVVRYLFKHDFAGATEAIDRAATLPDAPPAVVRFATLLDARRYGPETTIAILGQMREQATSDETRAILDQSILDARVAWDLERLTALIQAYRAREGRVPRDLGELVAAGMLNGVPPDLYGGVYEIDPVTGAARSSTGRVPLELHESAQASGK